MNQTLEEQADRSEARATEAEARAAWVAQQWRQHQAACRGGAGCEDDCAAALGVSGGFGALGLKV